MSIDWPPREIERVANAYGKPLEVVCAQAFLAAGWQPRFGFYFADGDKLREMDIVAERAELLPGETGITVRVRALVSCRGFPPERAPMMYTVSTSCVPGFSPRLLSSHRTSRTGSAHGTVGPLEDLEGVAAKLLLRLSQLDSARPVVAYDVVERRTETEKKGTTTVTFGRYKEGEKELWSAVDSCVKGALFWLQEDYQRNDILYFSTLNVPACVLSQPFWDVCIDGGRIAAPETRDRGYQTNLYPHRGSTKEVMTLIWNADQISELVEALDTLFAWFRGEALRRKFEGGPDILIR